MEASSGISSVARWESLPPKMAVRVLLVEADDSTRKIIAALLKKCSYRVSAVTDGLKAWEVLKGSPCNIDLILTEVELPLISGYALLTLIMEHEAYKNIPVIMMSSQDSVSTVYKCMLRGASDFLVKPVRKNELANLWQHVWRKQAVKSGTYSGLGLLGECVQQKEETTDENNAILSNHSSDYISSVPCTEKGSDDQSSCTKTGSETGDCVSKQQKDYLSDNFKVSCVQEQRHRENSEKRSHENETRETRALADKNAENARALEKRCDEAIDLIGTFDSHMKCNFGIMPTNVGANKFDDIFPLLDLSLNPDINERPRLNHSDASPFSRYINKTVSHDNHPGQETIPENVTITTIRIGSSDTALSYSHNKETSHPIPDQAVRFEHANSAYLIQSDSSSLSSPHTPRHTESFPQCSLFYPSHPQPPLSSPQILDKKIGDTVVQTEDKQENMVPSNFCCRDRARGVHVSKGSSEYTGHEQSLRVHGDASTRSMQREAALMKFRLKRKDRCFEKRVRYESRKKLAEQRPRVKGQFVRQSVE